MCDTEAFKRLLDEHNVTHKDEMLKAFSLVVHDTTKATNRALVEIGGHLKAQNKSIAGLKTAHEDTASEMAKMGKSVAVIETQLEEREKIYQQQNVRITDIKESTDEAHKRIDKQGTGIIGTMLQIGVAILAFGALITAMIRGQS